MALSGHGSAALQIVLKIKNVAGVIGRINQQWVTPRVW